MCGCVEGGIIKCVTVYIVYTVDIMKRQIIAIN